MPVEIGQQAPDFTLFDSKQQPWTLSEHLEGNTVLLFFPGAFTSVCTAEMCTVNDDLERYDDLDAQVVGISTDSPTVLQQFRDAYDLDFTLLSDFEATVSERYGAKFSRDEHRLGYDRVAKRAAFVIDQDGQVRYAEVLANPAEQPDYDAIQKALESLQ